MPIFTEEARTGRRLEHPRHDPPPLPVDASAEELEAAAAADACR